MKLQLTISLLVSDRMDTLKKSLDSISPLLRELNSELIIVFTGKDSAVLETARQYTSHIISFTWCDDFAKARNAGLKEAKGEWFLYLDDDEWFEDVSEIIRFFKTGEYRGYDAATYIQRNYNDLEGKTYNDAHVGRMCRLTPEIQFVSPIHESLYPFPDSFKSFSSYVHHYAYARVGTDADRKARFQRNASLLLKVYKKEPTAHNCMQLAQEYRYIDDELTAIKYCREGLKLASKEKRIHTYELWMQVHLPLMLSVVGKPEEALKEGERILRSPRLLEVGQAHIHSILATLCLDLREYKNGLRHVRSLHKTMLYLEKHPEKAMRQTGASITYATAREHEIPAYVVGLFFAAELKDIGMLKDILSWMPWNDENQIQAYYDNLEKLKAVYPMMEEAILEGYSYLQTDNAYVNLQKALYAEKEHKIIEAEEYFKICAGNCPIEVMHQVVEFAKRTGCSLSPLAEQISIETWDEYAKILAEKLDVSDMPDFIQKLTPALSDYPIYIRRLEQQFLEKQFSNQDVEDEKLLKLLEQYCTSIRMEARILYNERILTGPKCYILPYKYRFAFCIEAVLSNIESGEYKDGTTVLRKAIQFYPQKKISINYLNNYLEKKSQLLEEAEII